MKLTDLVASMKSLDTTKATGIDGITTGVIKRSADIVLTNLLHLINISIQRGHFTDLLKIEKLKPLFESGSKSDPPNYRPIYILLVVYKIIEKHVAKHLFAFLNKYRLLQNPSLAFAKAKATRVIQP